MISLYNDTYNFVNQINRVEQFQAMITSPNINSPVSKLNISDISKLISLLDSFTVNLQSKVDGILKSQQNQFLHSYRDHMNKIKEQFDRVNQELKIRDAQILQYENDGKMSNLIKRVNYLELQQKKLLGDLQKKKNDIRELSLEKAILKSEQKRLEDKIKQLIRSKVSVQEKCQKQHQNCQQNSVVTFSTEIQSHKLKRPLAKIFSVQRNLKHNSVRHGSQKSQILLNPQPIEINASSKGINNDITRLNRQVSQLKKQNKQLIMMQSKYNKSLMQSFFIQTINDMKKDISTRKKLKECSLEDFKKQDKLQLLIKILSNDQVLVSLYQIIFNKKVNQLQSNYDEISSQRSPTVMKKISGVEKLSQIRFPSLKSARLS